MTKITYEWTMQYKSIAYDAATHTFNLAWTSGEWPWMMKTAKVRCPDCGSTHVRKNGTNAKLNKQYQCLNNNCERSSFVI